jgi:hypothetical protein
LAGHRRLWCVTALATGLVLALSGSAVAADPNWEPQWTGTLSASINGSWGTNGAEGPQRLTDSESLSFETSFGGATSASVSLSLFDLYEPNDCGRDWRLDIGKIGVPKGGVDANGNSLPPIAVEGPSQDGSYGVSPPALTINTHTVFTKSNRDLETTACYTDVFDQDGGWFLGGIFASGTAPPGTVTLRGSSGGISTNWIGGGPTGTAQWNLTCVEAQAGRTQHVMKLKAIQFSVGTCAPGTIENVRWDDHVDGDRYVDVATPDAVGIVKGRAAYRAGLGPYSSGAANIPADQLTNYRLMFYPAGLRTMRAAFRNHHRLRGVLHVKVRGRAGRPSVVTTPVTLVR